MGKKLLFMLLAGLMLVPTGCGQQDKSALPKEQSEQTASSKLNPSEPVIDGENKVYTLGGIEIPLPLEHLGKMIVITDFPKERSDGETLLETYEKASVEALKKTSSSEDGGFLFGFNVMNQAQFEQLLANDVGGCSVFARKGDNYYAKTYGFTAKQLELLTEMLEQRAMLNGLVGSLTVTAADAAEVLRNLPADLPEDRKAVIKTAMQLVGKVSYFWGGKSSAIGWDSRFGTPMEVWADGSPTTGTIRAYGLDCSGYVDWAFNNALGYVIGHGGGAASQHTYCEDISWDEAQIGDLAFYPDDEHIGIVAGWDESGNILIVHCASGYNNVVITGKEGFTSVGRPDIFL